MTIYTGWEFDICIDTISEAISYPVVRVQSGQKRIVLTNSAKQNLYMNI